MFKILVIDEDVTNNRKFEECVKNSTKYKLTIVPSVEKATELIAPDFNKEKKATVASTPTSPAASPAPTTTAGAAPAVTVAAESKTQASSSVPDLIFVDIAKIIGEPAQWYINLREMLKAAGNENVPIILLSLASDPIFIRSFLGSGVHDVFVKPVVSTILQATLEYFLDNKKEQPKKMTPLRGTVEMYSQALAREISEFEIKIVTPKQILLNNFKPIYGDFFKWTPGRRVIGRCTDCQEDEEVEGSFVETFTFVGVPPAITKEIRVWLKNQYVTQKQKGKQE